MWTTGMPPLLYVVILFPSCGLLAETIKPDVKDLDTSNLIPNFPKPIFYYVANMWLFHMECNPYGSFTFTSANTAL